AADIRCQHLLVACGQHGFKGSDDSVGRRLVPQVFQHHGTGPDLADRVGDALAGDIRSAAVYRFEQAGELAFGIDVGRRCHADGAGAGWSQIGENVAKQVAGNHDIKPVGMQDEVGGKDVDMELVDMDLGVVI